MYSLYDMFLVKKFKKYYYSYDYKFLSDCMYEAYDLGKKAQKKVDAQKETLKGTQKEKSRKRTITIIQNQDPLYIEIGSPDEIHSFLQYRMAILTITDEKLEIALSLKDKSELREKLVKHAKTLSLTELKSILLELEKMEDQAIEPLHKICCLHAGIKQLITLGYYSITLCYNEEKKTGEQKNSIVIEIPNEQHLLKANQAVETQEQRQVKANQEAAFAFGGHDDDLFPA